MVRWIWRLLAGEWLGNRRMTIGLDELSSIWQGANHGVQSLDDAILQPVVEVAAAPESESLDAEPVESGDLVVEATGNGEADRTSAEPPPAAPPPSLSRSDAANLLEAGARSPMVDSFLTPYERLLRSQGVWEPLVMIVGMLETLGHCPSVVMVAADSDKEARRELYALRDTLGKVTLRNHTELVTHLAMQEVQSHYRNPELVMPKMLVAALGHDLGKIPEYRLSGAYTKKDHPEISVVKVRELFEGRTVPWLEDALELIRTHHVWTKNELGIRLRLADGKAREIEVARMTKELRIAPWEEWCTVPLLCAVLAERVNVIDRAGKWNAFAYGETVFCTPEALWWAVRELARRAKVIDIRLVREADKEWVLRMIAQMFREADALSYPVGEGYYGRKFRIYGPESRRKRGTSQWYALPIKRAAFGAAAGQFVAPEGYLEMIHDVELVA